MKVLHLNIFFKLPEDFDGDLDNAIAEILKYRKALREKHEGLEEPLESEANKKIPMTCTMEAYMEAMWADFLNAVGRGKKLVGEILLTESGGNKERMMHTK